LGRLAGAVPDAAGSPFGAAAHGRAHGARTVLVSPAGGKGRVWRPIPASASAASAVRAARGRALCAVRRGVAPARLRRPDAPFPAGFAYTPDNSWRRRRSGAQGN